MSQHSHYAWEADEPRSNLDDGYDYDRPQRRIPASLWVLATLLVIANIALITLLATTPVHAAEATPKLVTLNQINHATLLLRAAKPGHYVEAPIVASDVDVTITGPIVRARITQRFINPSKGWVEAIYVFPLADKAAVDSLKMIIGTRVIEGKIKERKQARIIYEQAKREGRKAALMEQQRPNMFTNAIANIGPGETVIVQIEYQQVVRRTKDLYSLRVPLVVGPRFNPKPSLHLVGMQPGESPDVVANDPVSDRKNITPPVANPKHGKRNPISLTFHLNAGFALGDIKSPHHKIKIEKIDRGKAKITLGDGVVPADKDFELTWKPDTQKAPMVTLFKESLSSGNYILAVITPPSLLPKDELKAKSVRPPRDIIFVIDNSGSMAGPSMRQAKKSLIRALDRLKPSDKFNVIRFDDTFDQLFLKALKADVANISTAKDFVAKLQADGGTQMLPALKAALIDPTPGNQARLRQIVFLTDGAIGNETQLFSEIKANRGRSRIFTVGIGSAPNSYFMTRAAMHGRGTFTHIGSAEQVSERMDKLFDKLENPMLTDLKVTWPKNTQSESWPNPLPDLYLGEPVVMTARLDVLKGEITLTGRLAGKAWKQVLALAQAQKGKGVAKLWARHKILVLEGRRQSNNNHEMFDKAILKTALNHGLVSRLTSLVAVDTSSLAAKSRPDGAPLTKAEIPLNLPAGWQFDKMLGTQKLLRKAQMRRVKPGYSSLLKMAAAARPTNMPNPAVTTTTGINLPAGATPAMQKIIFGILSLALALSLGLLLVFWRHLRQSYAPRARI